MNEEKIINIKVEGAQAIQRITELFDDLQKVDQQIVNLDKSSKDYKATLTVLTQQQKAYKDELRILGTEIKNTIKQESEQLGYIQKLEAEVGKLTTQYKKLSEEELKGDKGSQVLTNLSAKRAELAKLNEAYGSYQMNVGNYSSATKGLQMSVAQMATELPNAAQSMRIFIMSLSNNWQNLFNALKNVNQEQGSLKGTLKTFAGSLFSMNVVLMVAVTLFSAYGEKIINWVGSLFKGKDAVDKLRNSMLGLQSTQQIMAESMKSSGNEYGNAITQIQKMTVALEQAKGNHKEEKHAVDEYNNSLGNTFGKAKDVNEALSLINKNKDAYVQAMKEMSFSNAFFAKSAEDAVKIMEIQLKSNGEILGETANKFKERIQGWVDYIEGLKKDGAGKKTMESAYAGLKEATDAYNYYAKVERDKQIAAVTKHQNQSEKLAEKHYANMSNLYDKHNWSYNDKQVKAQKLAEQNQVSAINIYEQATEEQLAKLDEYIAKLDSKAIEEQHKLLNKDVESVYGKNNGNDSEVQQAAADARTRIDLLKNQLADEALLKGGAYAEQKELNDQRMREELANTLLTEEQKTLIRKRYAKIDNDIEHEKLQYKLKVGSQLANAVSEFAGKNTKIGKAAAAAGVTIDTIAGGIAAVKAGIAAFGLPLGPILGGAQAAALAISGAAAIKQIYAVNDSAVSSAGGSNTQTTTVTEKYHTGTYRPSTPSEEKEITRTLLTTERVLSPTQTSIFDRITTGIQSMGGANNIVGNVGNNAMSNYDLQVAAFSQALKSMPAPVTTWKDFDDSMAKKVQWEQNRSL